MAAGYSFGDRPVNRILAGFLAGRKDRKIRLWKRSGSQGTYLARLRGQLADGQSIDAGQLVLEAVTLPNSAAVDALV